MKVKLNLRRIEELTQIKLTTTALTECINYVLGCLRDDHPAIFDNRRGRHKGFSNRHYTQQAVSYIVSNANDRLNMHILGVIFYIYDLDVEQIGYAFDYALPSEEDFKVNPEPHLSALIGLYNKYDYDNVKE